MPAQAPGSRLVIPEGLGAEGKRSFARFQPVKPLQAQLSMASDSGTLLTGRTVRDLSLGGASFWVSFWESRRVPVGEAVQIDLTLGRRTLAIRGHCVHLWGPSEWWARRFVGLSFYFDAVYEQAWPTLVKFLLHVQARTRGLNSAAG